MKDTEIVVYYKGEKPDTIYKVYNKPEIGENPYCTIEGYWMPVDDGTDTPKYNFVENQNKRPMKFDKEWLINRIIPDKTAVKEFDTLNDFMRDNFLENI
jgi:hypothetical protein